MLNIVPEGESEPKDYPATIRWEFISASCIDKDTIGMYHIHCPKGRNAATKFTFKYSACLLNNIGQIVCGKCRAIAPDEVEVVVHLWLA